MTTINITTKDEILNRVWDKLEEEANTYASLKLADLNSSDIKYIQALDLATNDVYETLNK